MDPDVPRRLRKQSDALLTEADRLEAIERTVDALPTGSQEIVDATGHAHGQAVRLHDVAHKGDEMTREAAARGEKPKRGS
jgi:hypothetical protein